MSQDGVPQQGGAAFENVAPQRGNEGQSGHQFFEVDVALSGDGKGKRSQTTMKHTIKKNLRTVFSPIRVGPFLLVVMLAVVAWYLEWVKLKKTEKVSVCTGVSGEDAVKCTLNEPFGGSCAVGRAFDHGEGQPKCNLKLTTEELKPSSWKGYVALAGVFCVIWFSALGIAPELVMMSVCTIFGFCGIISDKEAFSGFGDPSIIALVILFIVSNAIERSELLDILLSKALSKTNSVMSAQCVLCLASGILSGFVNNTPLCAMLMPVIVTWSLRRGVDPNMFLLPLAYSCSVGGGITKIGSPPNMIAAAKLNDMGISINFIELGIACFPMLVATALYTMFAGPFLLTASRPPPGQTAITDANKNNAAEPLVPAENVALVDESVVPPGMYRFSWRVAGCAAGKSWAEMGLQFIGNSNIEHVRRNGVPVEDAAGPPEEVLLEAFDEIVVNADAGTIALQRRVDGLELVGGVAGSINKFGSKRRKRCLFEVVCPKMADDEFRCMLAYHHCALFATREAAGGYRIALVEANANTFEAQAKFDFGLISMVQHSTPPRKGRRSDNYRAWITIVIVFVALGLNTIPFPAGGGKTKNLSLVLLSLSAAFLFLLFDIMTVEEELAAMSLKAYLTLSSAYGVGHALKNTGIAYTVGSGMCTAVLGDTGGEASNGQIFAVGGAVMLVCSILTNLMSNAGTMVLMIPVITSMSDQFPVLKLKYLAFCAIFGCNAPFSTPFAAAVNVMVQDAAGPNQAGYTFMDYVKFGVPLQILCLGIGVSMSFLWVEVLEK